LHRLDLETREVSKLPDSEGLFAPRWSPDGRYVAALPFDQQRLVLFDFTTGKWADLTEGEGETNHPIWSRDGTHLYFQRIIGEDSGVFRVRVSDGKLEKVVDLKGFRQAMGRYYPWSGLGPDDSVLLMRDVGIHEIYAFDWEVP
jgi:Tol biopolymer transport system component